MLIRGRLTLTKSSRLMLDEAKSALQKGLRRRDGVVVRAFAEELVSQAKPGHILTYLLEDHNTASLECMKHVTLLMKSGNLVGAVKYMLQHGSLSRQASCLSTAVIGREDPVSLDLPAVVKAGDIDGAARLINKICVEPWAAVSKEDQQHVREVLTTTNRKLKLTQLEVTLAAICSATTNEEVQQYCICLGKLLELLPAPDRKKIARLVLFSAVCRMETPGVDFLNLELWPVEKTDPVIPPYAIDKHTYRGRTGKGVDVTLLAKEVWKPELYGPKPRQDIHDFWTKGVVCAGDAHVNKYWDEAKAVYTKNGFLKTKAIGKKRKATWDEPRAKIIKKNPDHRFAHRKAGKVGTTLCGNMIHIGSYSSRKLWSHTAFSHYAMKHILKDGHTLPATFAKVYNHRLYSKPATDVKFKDYIQGGTPISTRFVKMSSVALCVLKEEASLTTFPGSLWCHFIYRYALDIANTPVYTAIAVDPDTGETWGVAMGRGPRENVTDDGNIVQRLFIVKPEEAVVTEILAAMKDKKAEILDHLAIRMNAVFTEALKFFNLDLFKTRLSEMTALMTAL